MRLEQLSQKVLKNCKLLFSADGDESKKRKTSQTSKSDSNLWDSPKPTQNYWIVRNKQLTMDIRTCTTFKQPTYPFCFKSCAHDHHQSPIHSTRVHRPKWRKAQIIWLWVVWDSLQEHSERMRFLLNKNILPNRRPSQTMIFRDIHLGNQHTTFHATAKTLTRRPQNSVNWKYITVAPKT